MENVTRQNLVRQPINRCIQLLERGRRAGSVGDFPQHRLDQRISSLRLLRLFAFGDIDMRSHHSRCPALFIKAGALAAA